jgi:hypothetical protein
VAPIQKVGGTNWNAAIACSLWHGSLGCTCPHASSPATRKTQIGGWHQFKRWVAPIGMLFLECWRVNQGGLQFSTKAGLLPKDRPWLGEVYKNSRLSPGSTCAPIKSRQCHSWVAPFGMMISVPARCKGELSKDDVLRKLRLILSDLARLTKSPRTTLGALKGSGAS